MGRRSPPLGCGFRRSGARRRAGPDRSRRTRWRPLPTTFTAFVARTDDGTFSRGIEELPTSALGEGGVLVRVERSSVNYKDSLAASEKGRVARISPLVVGDRPRRARCSRATAPTSRRVTSSSSRATTSASPTTAVSRSSRGSPPSGSCRCRQGTDVDWAMTIGTAGYTAALSVVALQHHGLVPGAGPVVVTGATGGVGSVAVSILAGLGYEVVASSGKPRGRGLAARAGRHVGDRPCRAGRDAEAADARDLRGRGRLRRRRHPRGRGRPPRARRRGRGERQHRRRAARHDRAAVHPPRRVVARHRLGHHADRPDAARSGSAWPRDLAPQGLDAIRRIVALTDVEARARRDRRGGVQGRYVVDTTA